MTEKGTLYIVLARAILLTHIIVLPRFMLLPRVMVLAHAMLFKLVLWCYVRPCHAGRQG